MGNGVVTPSNWDMYRNTINTFHKSVGKHTIIWKKMVADIDRFGEGFTAEYIDIELEVLMGYNDNRTWPVNKIDNVGTRDDENVWLYLNKKVLEEAGHLNARGYLDFNPGRDRFWIEGIEYIPAGDVSSSLAYDSPLYILLILRRNEQQVGNPIR
jgi:hypothetical protein